MRGSGWLGGGMDGLMFSDIVFGIPFVPKAIKLKFATSSLPVPATPGT